VGNDLFLKPRLGSVTMGAGSAGSVLVVVVDGGGSMPKSGEDRIPLLAVWVAILAGMAISFLVEFWQKAEFALLLLPALAFFWAWVGLGSCLGLLVTHRWLAPMGRWQAHGTAQLTAILCATCLYLGVHNDVLRSVRELRRFNWDLVAYYLVWIQFLYFGLATLASLLVSLALLLCAHLSGSRRAV
jgi:hypothetical protein